MLFVILIIILLALTVGTALPDEGTIEVKSPEFRALVPEDAKIEKIADGFQFTEGPVWHKDGYLLFSDIPANKIYKWHPEEGLSVYDDDSGNANGLTFDNQGRLLRCEHGNRRVARENVNDRITVPVSHYMGKRMNSPNDIVVKSDGSLYFTDPPYGVQADDREMDFQGVFRLSPYGRLTLLSDDFDRPNGLAFSPDEKVLYIADSSSRLHIRAFDVQKDGSLANDRVFIDMKTGERGAPDGMKVDTEGNLWSTGTGGVWVISPEGKHLGTIKPAEIPANCAWGDDDGKTLYMTARTGLYRIRTNAQGIRPWMD